MMNLDLFYKSLLSDNPSEEIKNNEDYFFELIPELKEGKGLEQKSKWHIYDVYNHILHVVDGIDNNIYLRMAALFHDVGKPKTMIIDDKGNGHFTNHYFISNEIFLEFAKKYNLDKKTIDLVSKLIIYHDKDITKLKHISSMFTMEEIKMLYNLKRSDLLAQSREFHYLLDKYDFDEIKLRIIYEYNIY